MAQLWGLIIILLMRKCQRPGSKGKGKSSGMVFYPSGFCGCGYSRNLYLDLLDPEEDGLMGYKNTGCTVIYFPL